MQDVVPYSPLISAAVTMLLIFWMLKAQDRLPLDVPNERSLHTRPVPRSGGLAIMAGIFCGFAILRTPLVIVLPAALLVVVSLVDDVRGLPIAARFATQLVAAAWFAFGALTALPLPLLLVIIVGVMWATNLYNFMDGSDGLAGGMALFGFAFLGAGAWLNRDDVLLIECGIIAAAAAGFLLFNFPPARIFMGDAGSVPIGFLAVVLSLAGWRDGDFPFWFPAVVFAPFVADATLTLLRRVLAGEPFWRAHKTHYYQRFIRLGRSHRALTLVEYGLMLSCGAAGLWALSQPVYLQVTAGLALVGVFAALALWLDAAWRRHHKSHLEAG